MLKPFIALLAVSLCAACGTADLEEVQPTPAPTPLYTRCDQPRPDPRCTKSPNEDDAHRPEAAPEAL